MVNSGAPEGWAVFVVQCYHVIHFIRSKGKSLSINRRRKTTDTTMAKTKRTNNNLQEVLKDTKGVIRIRKFKRNRQDNGQKKKDK